MKNVILTKLDVRTHNSGGYEGTQYPALNVKVQEPIYNRVVPAIIAKWGCEQATAAKALGWAFESAQETFWEAAQEWVTEIWGPRAKVYSAGRSGGWLVVEGLPDIEDWDGRALSKWRKLALMVDKEIEYQLRTDTLMECIEVNEWWQDGPSMERYEVRRAGMEQLALNF